MERTEFSSRSFFEVYRNSAEITDENLQRLQGICKALSVEIEAIIMPVGNDSFLWQVWREIPRPSEKSPHFWGQIVWTQNGKVVATTSSLSITDHQLDPRNIKYFVGLLVHALETKKAASGAA